MALGTSLFPTCYSGLSNVELNGLFTTDTWNGLGTNQRLAACQEVENRYAAQTGHQPLLVSAVPMINSADDGFTWGYQYGNRLYLNLDVLQSGQFLLSDQDENGNDIITAVRAPAPNWKMLETVYHEGTHGFQYQEGRQSPTYIRPEADFDLYRIQPVEAEAFLKGNACTIQAIQQQMELTGKVDPNAQTYLNGVKINSYQNSLQDAARNYNDPHIDQTLVQFIYDRDHNIQPKDPSPSYQAISKTYDQSLQEQQSKSENDQTGPLGPDPSPTDSGQQNKDDSQQKENGSQQDNGGSYQDDGGSYQDDGSSYQDDGGSYQDDGSSYQDDGSSYQDDGGSYQDDGSSYQDDGGSYQDDGSSYQDDGGSYQDDGSSYQDSGGSGRDGGMNYD